MSEARTCILVADESKAAVYDSYHGMSQLNRITSRPCGLAVPVNEAREAFALRLASDISRDVQNNLYDGIIIFAAPKMLQAIRDWLSPQIRKLLIAEMPCPAVADTELPARISCGSP